jgi:hypothetical protein
VEENGNGKRGAFQVEFVRFVIFAHQVIKDSRIQQYMLRSLSCFGEMERLGW